MPCATAGSSASTAPAAAYRSVASFTRSRCTSASRCTNDSSSGPSIANGFGTPAAVPARSSWDDDAVSNDEATTNPVLAFLGGTGDQGRGLAQRFAMAGLEVVIGSRDAARAKQAAGEVREVVGD